MIAAMFFFFLFFFHVIMQISNVARLLLYCGENVLSFAQLRRFYLKKKA